MKNKKLLIKNKRTELCCPKKRPLCFSKKAHFLTKGHSDNPEWQVGVEFPLSGSYF